MIHHLSILKKDETHYLLNSKGLIKQQLLNCDVLEEHIEVSPYCTMENDDLFFSYRKTHTKNRNISIIRLKIAGIIPAIFLFHQ